MTIHGLRPEFQPEAMNEKARLAKEANNQADRPVRGHDDVVPPLKPSELVSSSKLLDIKG